MIKYEIYELLKKSGASLSPTDIQKELSIDAESIADSLSELVKHGVKESEGYFYSSDVSSDLGYDIF